MSNDQSALCDLTWNGALFLKLFQPIWDILFYWLSFFCQIAMCSLRCSHLTNFLFYRHATVEQAVKALKIDTLRTFKSRLEMHCDSLVGDKI